MKSRCIDCGTILFEQFWTPEGICQVTLKDVKGGRCGKCHRKYVITFLNPKKSRYKK